MLNRKNIFPLALVFYELFVYLSTDMYLPALPSVQKSFAILSQETQAALSAWFLGAGCCQWFTGPLSDYYGRKPILLTSVLIYIIACLICATTNNFKIFLIARFIQGGMIGPIFVGGYAAIHEKFSSNEAIKILALMSCITISAPTLGPMIGALIIENYKWQMLFLILGILSGIAGVILLLFMPETLKAKTEVNFKDIAKSYYKAIRNQKFIIPIIANCCTFAAMITWITMSAFITNKYGFTAKEYGLFQLLVFGCYILGNRSISLLLGKYKKEKIIKIGLNFASIIGTLLYIIYLYHDSTIIALTTVSCIAFGAGMCGPNLQKMAMEQSKEPLGLKMAIFSTAISISGAIISFIISFLQNTWGYLIISMLACILIAFILQKKLEFVCQK